MKKKNQHQVDMMELIANYEIHHLRLFLTPHQQANVLILGDDVPASIWDNHQWHGILAIHQQQKGNLSIPQIQANYHELPLLADSIDFIIVYHALDFATERQPILKELWRVLAPEGKLLILGYNAKALFGLPKAIIKHFQKPIKHLGISALSQLVKQQGFTQESLKTFCFMPPQFKVFQITEFVENLGKFLWPHWGIIYLLVANKPLLTLTPIKKLKKPKLHFSIKGLAAHTHRSRIE